MTATVVSEADPPSPRLHRWMERTGFALAVAVLTLVIDGVFLSLVAAIVPSPDDFEGARSSDWQAWWAFYVVFVGPWIETALMAFVLHWGTRLAPPWLAVAVCASLMTALHWEAGGINWFVAPAFVLLSIVYLVRRRPAWNDAFMVTALSHAFTNLLLYVLAIVLMT